jgi:hypothetical protein
VTIGLDLAKHAAAFFVLRTGDANRFEGENL